MNDYLLSVIIIYPIVSVCMLAIASAFFRGASILDK